MTRFSLTTRVMFAAGLAVLAVIVAHAVLLQRMLESEATTWEREHLSALAHHLAYMVAEGRPGDPTDFVTRATAGLGEFGFELRVAPRVTPATARSVSVPVGDGPLAIEASTTYALTGPLIRNLRRSSLFLALGTLGALLIAVQATIYLGLVRPLRGVRRQVHLMRLGPWATSAPTEGGAEVVALARDLEDTGRAIDRSISEWVAAERRAAYELARIKLRNAVLPHLREINLIASTLLALGTAGGETRRAIKSLVGAGESLARAFQEAAPDHPLAGAVLAKGSSGPGAEGPTEGERERGQQC